MSNRKILMIAGCHRSGTSALTGLLAHLGWDLPNTLMGKSKWNQKGYFESPEIRDFHDAILERIDRPVYDLRPTPPEVDFPGMAQEMGAEIDALLQDQFGGSQKILIKDPRLCRLMPLWQSYAATRDDTLRAILTVRHPLEVAGSLHSRNQFSLEEGQMIWLRENIMALRYLRTMSASILRFEDLLTDWRGVLTRIFNDLNIHLAPLSAETRAEIDAFLSPKLRRQVADQDSPARSDWVSDLAQRSYEALGTHYTPIALDLVHALLDMIMQPMEEVSEPGPEAQAAFEALQPSMRLLVPPLLASRKSVPPPADLRDALDRIYACEVAYQNGRKNIASLENQVNNLLEDNLALETELTDLRQDLQDRCYEISHLLQRLEKYR